MRKLCGIVILMMGFNSFAQEGFDIGLDVTPSFKLNYHNSKTVAGFRSFESGYGFSVGIPMKYWAKENLAIGTGVNFEYTAFDRFNNGILVNSQRFSSVQVPLRLHIRMREQLFFTAGSGANYIFAGRRIDSFVNIPISDRLRRFQPYLSAGVNIFKPTDKGALEFGVQGRYYFLDVWNKNEPTYATTSSHFLIFDFFIRYYL